MTTEYHLLIATITRRLNVSMASTANPKPLTSHLADARATTLYALKQRSQLTKPDVEEILASCNDRSQPSKDKWRELTGERFVIEPDTVRKIAWRLTSQHFEFEEKAYASLIAALDDTKVIVCAAAARLLQHSNRPPKEVSKQAAQKIMKIVTDDELSHRWLELPDYTKIWRLDDVLFETLEVLAE
jgi:hypothetical protein